MNQNNKFKLFNYLPPFFNFSSLQTSLTPELPTQPLFLHPHTSFRKFLLQYIFDASISTVYVGGLKKWGVLKKWGDGGRTGKVGEGRKRWENLKIELKRVLHPAKKMEWIEWQNRNKNNSSLPPLIQLFLPLTDSNKNRSIGQNFIYVNRTSEDKNIWELIWYLSFLDMYG